MGMMGRDPGLRLTGCQPKTPLITNFTSSSVETGYRRWLNPLAHDRITSSMQSTFFLKNGCSAFNEPSDAHAPYAVNATTAEDYKKTLQFVRDKNIRFVIGNTGPDYM